MKAVKLAEVAIERYSIIFNQAWIKGMRCKLGLFGEEADDFLLIQGLLDWMQTSKADYTSTFRHLTQENTPENESYNSMQFQKWHTLVEEKTHSKLKAPKSFSLSDARE